MSAPKRGANGKSYRPVTMAEVLAQLSASGRPISAAELGGRLWPHLDGRGPARGGPSSCAVAASYALGKLRQRGKAERLPDRTWRATKP